jgi:biopolymer transport protein ExbD
MLAGGAAEARNARLAAQEITVLADKSLPYEVVKKVMATCTAASYGKISLAVIERDKPLDAAGLETA